MKADNFRRWRCGEKVDPDGIEIGDFVTVGFEKFLRTPVHPDAICEVFGVPEYTSYHGKQRASGIFSVEGTVEATPETDLGCWMFKTASGRPIEFDILIWVQPIELNVNRDG